MYYLYNSFRSIQVVHIKEFDVKEQYIAGRVVFIVKEDAPNRMSKGYPGYYYYMFLTKLTEKQVNLFGLLYG